MFQGHLQAVRSDQFLNRLRRLLDGAPGLRQGAVEVGNFLANSVRKLGVRKPGNVVKISRDSWRFLNVECDNYSRARLEVVADLVEKTGLCEIVSGSLQIRAPHLGARDEASQRYDLCFGKMFLASHANFA